MMLTAKQVAEMLGLSRSKVYELASSAKLPSYRFDGALRFESSDVETFITASRVRPSPMPTARQPLRSVALTMSPADGESNLTRYFRAHGLKPKARR
jgi:excisionase family DNA binding protein